MLRWGMQPLKLKWRRTWPDVPNDFVCEAPEAHGGLVGRIMAEESTFLQKTHWRWCLNGHIPSRNIILSRVDFCDDKNTAARCLEAAWFEALERNP